jgi:hypothetical protein
MCNKSKAANHANKIGSMMKFWHSSKPKKKSMWQALTQLMQEKFETVVKNLTKFQQRL